MIRLAMSGVADEPVIAKGFELVCECGSAETALHFSYAEDNDSLRVDVECRACGHNTKTKQGADYSVVTDTLNSLGTIG